MCYNRDRVKDPAIPSRSCEVCEQSFQSSICKLKHEDISTERCFEVVCNKCYELVPRKYLKINKCYQNNMEVYTFLHFLYMSCNKFQYFLLHSNLCIVQKVDER